MGLINNWRNAKTIQEYGYKPPEGMSKHDKLCVSCLDVIVKNNWIENGVCKECGNKPDPHFSYCLNCKSTEKQIPHKPIPYKPQKSPKSIKFDFYLTVIMIIASSSMVLSGLTGENPIGVIIGLPALIISVIQLPKRKKLFDGLSKTDNESLSVLKMRLAKGEITKEEFDKIKEDLKD